jgi:hypothetical protein
MCEIKQPIKKGAKSELFQDAKRAILILLEQPQITMGANKIDAKTKNCQFKKSTFFSRRDRVKI